uniref:Uncharacterized protein n=1 Tax=Panagrolaimus sp. ES5 TaxID=591445 RepID=A0AC34FWI2_9BILA
MEEENFRMNISGESDDELSEVLKRFSKLTNGAAVKTISQNIQQQNQRIIILKENITLLIENRMNLKEKNSKQKKFINEQKKKIQEANARFAEYENIIREKEEHSFVLNENNVKLEEKYKKRLERFNKIACDYEEVVKAEIAQLKSENIELQAKMINKDYMITRSQKKNQRIVAELEAKIKAKEENIEQLQAVLSDKDKIIESLKEKNEELQNENNRLKIKNAERRQPGEDRIDQEHDFEGCDKFSNGYGSQMSENEYDPSEDGDISSTASTENDDENSLNESDDEEESVSNEEMAPVNQTYSTIETQQYALFDKTLIVYLNDGAKNHRYHRNHGKFYYCGNCLNAKSGKSSRAEIINKNGREYVRVEKFHLCEMNGLMSFRDFENYEIHSNENGQKELVIFETEEKKKCYRYCYFSKNIPFYQCKFQSCKITAEICTDENRKEYVKAQWPHKNGCQPSEYIQSYKEDGFKFLDSGKKHQHLITFVKDANGYDKNHYYKFNFFEIKNQYYCSKCLKLKKSVLAKIWLDENGKKYVQLSAAHDCQPTPLP